MFRIVFLFLAFAAAPALAQDVQPAENTCAFRAWLNDPDPAGTNVRAGPGTQFEKLTVLPQKWGKGDEAFPPEVEVIGSSGGGWVKIRNATVGQYGDGAEKILFAGPGWISTKLISFEIQSGNLLDAPKADAKVTLDLTDSYAQGVFVDRIHSCQWEFVDVDVHTEDGKKGRGWVSNICANQVTTCN